MMSEPEQRAIYPRMLQKPDESFFLFGPRGTGKTKWLENNFPHAAIYSFLDEDLYSSLLVNPGIFADQIRRVPAGQWIVVDEIQRLPNLLNEVHRFIEKDGRKFALCGSSARKLRKGGVNLLAGRALERYMHPFTPTELGGDFDLEASLETGALPLIWSSTNRKERLKAYLQTYLRYEIQAEALVRNLPGFARFLPVAALFHGQVLSTSALARDAGVARTTVAGYLEVLVDTLLAFQIEAFTPRLKVKEQKHPKLFFCDPGIVRGLKKAWGPLIPEERGTLFEGWIAQQLRAYNDYVGVYDDLNYWSPHSSDTEVDFVLKRGKELIAIEAKATTRFDPRLLAGLDAISELSDVRRKILVYTGNQTYQTEPGIEVLPVKRFIELLAAGF